MPDKRWESWVVPIFKVKGDVKDCANYKGSKLMSHVIKLWVRAVIVIFKL